LVRAKRRLDAERLDVFDHLCGNSGVDAPVAEGDAALRPMVQERVLTMIARDVAFGSAFPSRLSCYTNAPIT
jgi:hypothetical protein